MSIFVGIDDTDSLDSRGTNKLARDIALTLRPQFRCRMIVRHQLLFDERIPFTSHNGSAGLLFEPRDANSTQIDLSEFFDHIKSIMLNDFIPDSDPGLCVASGDTVAHHLAELMAWGQRCQSEIVTQAEAIRIASATDVRLEGLGGTNGGVIGALAAIGLTASGNDGRLVGWGEWDDDLSGPTPVRSLREREIEVRSVETTIASFERNSTTSPPNLERFDGSELFDGLVDVGKHARPNLRDHHAVLFVTKTPLPTSHDAEWTALKLK